MVTRWLWLLAGVISLSGCKGLLIQQVSTIPTPTSEVTQAAQSGPISGSGPFTATDTIVPTPDREIEGNRRLAARVNDEPIFLDTYQQRVSQLEQVLETQEIDSAADTGQIVLADLRRQVLEGLIDQLIIEQQAAALSLTISDERLEVEVQESIARRQGQANFETWLGENDLKLDEFKGSLRAQLIANQLFEHITASVPTTAEQVRLQHIRVATAETAHAIIEQLKAGASFTALAQEQSLDTVVEPQWLPKGTGQLPGKVETVVFSLEPGQINGPIETDQGFFIIRLDDREIARPLTIEIHQGLKQRFFLDWLSVQRSTAEIEVYVP